MVVTSHIDYENYQKLKVQVNIKFKLFREIQMPIITNTFTGDTVHKIFSLCTYNPALSNTCSFRFRIYDIKYDIIYALFKLSLW